MYRTYALLPPGSPFALDEAAARLRAQFPKYTVTRTGDQITVEKGDWEIELRLNAAPEVLEESGRLAEKLSGLLDGQVMAHCDRRVDVWSDTPDPFVEHLADFQTVLETLRTFPGTILIDPSEPSLM